MKKTLPFLVLILLSACAGGQLEEQREEIESLKSTTAAFSSQLKEKLGELDALKAAKADADAKAAALEAKAADLDSKLATANQRLETLVKSNKDLSAASGASQSELGGKLKKVVAEKDELARRLAEAQNKLTDAKVEAERQRQKLERQRDVFKAARDRAAEEQGKLAARLAELDDAQRKAEERKAGASARAREDMGAVSGAAGSSVGAELSGESFALTISDALLFDENSVKIKDAGAALLARIGVALRALGERAIRVEVYTDNSPYKKGLLGGYEGHWELSAARAVAASRWLREHAGLEGSHLTAAGFGEQRPAHPNDTPEGRAANRRLVIVVSPPSASGTP